jgi:antitoxin ParD1/3/4
MNILISDRLLELIEQKIASGQYRSADDVIESAMRLLDERDKAIESLRRDVQRGLDQLARGDYEEYTDETLGQLFDELEAEAYRELDSRPNAN